MGFDLNPVEAFFSGGRYSRYAQKTALASKSWTQMGIYGL